MATVASVALPPPVGLAQRCDASSDLDRDECWICLSSAGSLSRVCDCPRVSHRECLARWQLTNYGRREENFCRFCSKRLPALWKPDAMNEGEKEELRVAPVMAVRYNGPEGTREFKLRVHPGPEGLATFKAHLKEILGFDVGPEFDVTFECQMPSTGSFLTLSGMNAYGAATHCAALLAATKTGSTQTPTTAATAAESSATMQQQHRGCTAQLQQQQEQHRQQLMQQRPDGPALLLPSEYDSYDDLLPLGPYTEALAPPEASLGVYDRVHLYGNSSGSGGGGGRRGHFTAAGLGRQHPEAAIVDADAEWCGRGRPATARGYSAIGRFCSRVAPVATLGVAFLPAASSDAAVAAAAAATSPLQATSERSAAAVLSSARSGPTARDIPREPAASTAAAAGANVPAGAVYDDSRTCSITDNVSSADSDGGSHAADFIKESLPLGTSPMSHPSGGSDSGIRKAQKCRTARRQPRESGKVPNDGDPTATPTRTPTAGADVLAESRGRMRLPVLVKRAARHAVDSLSRILMRRG
ncbi:hypothetical protein VOLCADRAFT_93070 [Volvox carteri f. nagariensis]|uniref:RING-CH-type domain-containing protein n=1 Tax=Volvox carteri f. nagariensis TaxID=3068 RepID=D8U197_VOLCA|nr:uncharacterized protein VOLCADRAFT_93070 [Volvox carteri f. nagariensis]EFJ46518.1 hypothetical protein VOLCADRAFT_93070 [Volvox carteri f. nagariensis]|eukprot:XP_002952375.1 hypothetical protein VOLCADRAFT_93070 [Volvox carteri f. nagariensis]